MIGIGGIINYNSGIIYFFRTDITDSRTGINLIISRKKTKKKIPELLEDGDLKGDLHMHTKYSDGENTVEEMAKKEEESSAFQQLT